MVQVKGWSELQCKTLHQEREEGDGKKRKEKRKRRRQRKEGGKVRGMEEESYMGVALP